MYEGKTLTCKECGVESVFAADEQEFYAAKGFVNKSQRCKDYHDTHKNTTKPEHEMFMAIRASCGKKAEVPFKPREGRPACCNECFAKMREESWQKRAVSAPRALCGGAISVH